MDKAPDAFRTISEVADDLDVPQHVLRFWETRFAQIRPMKRSGGRRYYRPDDVDLLRGIRRLLYGEGYTIRGVQKILKEHGVKAVQAFAAGAPLAPGTHGEAPPVRQAPPAVDQDREDGADAEQAVGEECDDVVADDRAPVAAGIEADEIQSSPPARHGPEALPIDLPEKSDPAARKRLREALDDLIACRAMLDQVLKAHPGKSLPE